MSRTKLILALVGCVCIWSTIGLSQDKSGLIKIEDKSGQKIPKKLLQEISIELQNAPLDSALHLISKKAGLMLNYNHNKIPVKRKISVKMEKVTALKALLEILKTSDAELYRTKEGQLLILPAGKKQKHQGQLKGRVLDQETKAPLFGVNVSLAGTLMGAATDEGGWFVIDHVPVGNYTAKITYIGFAPRQRTDVIVKSNRITFLEAELDMEPVEMQQVVVTGGYFARVEDQPVSAINFSGEEMRRSSGTMGDVSRAVYGLPAIAKINDSFNSLIVRGGSPSENTFFIDNIEMPNISHFGIQGTSGGFLSLFNGDLVRNVNFYSGGFSSIYGDKLSSVMDIAFREGNRDEFDMQLDMNFAGVGGIVEGPLPHEKGAWLLSARKSFVEVLFSIMGEDGNIPKYDDIQLQLNYDLSPKSQLTLLDIYGRSDLSSTREEGLNDGENEYGGVTLTQNTAGINWRYLWRKNGYSNTSISHTLWNYDWNWFQTKNQSELFDNQSIEQQFKLRNVNTYRFSPGHKIEFGADMKLQKADYEYFNAEDTDLFGNATPEFNLNRNTRTQKYGGFVSYSLRPFNKLTVTPGLRADYFAYSPNAHLSPRFSFTYQLTDRTAVNGATGMFYQSLPQFLLYQEAPNKDLKDPVANHYVLGLSHLLTENTRLTIEAYHKQYNNFPLDASTPALFIMDEPVYEVARFRAHEQLTDKGQAFSRGLEVMLQKKLAKNLYGLVSGSLFKTRYRDLNGVWRNRLFDNRFVFNIEGGYKPNEKWEFSVRWTYAGGRPYTPFDLEASRNLGSGVYDANRINGARTPDYNNLNLRFDRRFHFNKSNLIFYFSIWNALNSENIWHYQWNEVSNRQEAILQFERSPVFGFEFEF